VRRLALTQGTSSMSSGFASTDPRATPRTGRSQSAQWRLDGLQISRPNTAQTVWPVSDQLQTPPGPLAERFGWAGLRQKPWRSGASRLAAEGAERPTSGGSAPEARYRGVAAAEISRDLAPCAGRRFRCLGSHASGGSREPQPSGCGSTRRAVGLRSTRSRKTFAGMWEWAVFGP
jgi:hypothetical protein